MFLFTSGTQYMTVPFELDPRVGIKPTVNALKASALDTKLPGEMTGFVSFELYKTHEANQTR